MATIMEIEELQDILHENNIRKIIFITQDGKMLKFTTDQNKVIRDAIDLGLIAQKNIF